MKKLLERLISPLVLGTLGLLAVSAVIWWVGPLITIGNVRPLDGWLARLIVLLLLWAAWLSHWVIRSWRRRRANAQLLDGIASAPSASDAEARILAERFQQAVQRLKIAGGRRGWAALTAGERHLYELPWYAFVGAPGSGKSTALMNAGLQFLLGDPQQAAVQGVGGTRNCEWWFTRDAVLIDTAGRYTTHDSNREVDAAAWDHFLSLLKKFRPRQPLNGVLLTINVQDLLQQGSVERSEHAAKLRARLQELQGKLSLRAPVYVLVTKADLMAGFSESFEAMSQEDRQQVWGFTFAPDTPSEDPLRDFLPLFQDLQKRLIGQLPDRMDAERDIARRQAIFSFPQEFAALQGVLGDFLRQVFAGGGQVERAPWVRGVYFTSGTQEGSPIDRVMGTIGRSFGIASRGITHPAGRGRSYFLHRLLKDVVFAERGLGMIDRGAERRRRFLRGATAAGIGVMGLMVTIGWLASRSNNLDHAEQVTQRLPALKQAVASVPAPVSADVTPLGDVLVQVRDAAKLEAFPVDQPPWGHGLGLYQGDKLEAGAQQAYHRLLQKTLMPRIALRLEEKLRAVGRDNLEDAYEALKAYLMLHDPEHFDSAALRAWIGADWDVQYARMAPEQRATLDNHLDALLALGPPLAAAPLDRALVGNVREMLAAFPLAYRVWSRIQRSYRAGEVPDFSVAGGIGPNGAQVFVRTSGEPLSKGVSGLYTKAGYERVVKPSVQKLALQLAQEEGWVLGLKIDPTRLKDLTLGNAQSDKVKGLYFAAYIQIWDKLLADVRLAPLTGLDRSLAAARILAAPDSPLLAWLRAVTEETRLVRAAKAQDKTEAAKTDAVKLLGGPAVDTNAAGGPIERMVDDHFANLHRQVSGQPAPIDETLKLFAEVAGQLAAVDAAKKAGSPPPAAGGDAKVAASLLPQPLSQMLGALADAAANQGRDAERSVLSADLKPINDLCLRAVNGRYPFASGSRADVPLEDFGQLFGSGGLMDEFFQRRLNPLVDVSRDPWAYRAVEGGKPVAAAALAEFQRAQRIRDVFFRSGGKAPSLRFELKLAELEPSLKELVFDIDGQAQRLNPGGPSMTISWPPARMASVLKISTGLADRGPQIEESGPWALFRIFDKFELQPGQVPEKFSVVMTLDGKRARIEVISASVFNPFRLREIRQFRCPTAL